MLGTMLDSHPAIRCFSEVFHPVTGEFSHAQLPASEAGPFLEQLLTTDTHAAVGFKLPWDSLLTTPEAWPVIRNGHFRLIRLRRRNLLDQYLSLQLSLLNGVWHSYDGRYQRQRLRIDVADCRAHLQHFTMGNMMLDEMSRGFARTEVTYEDLVQGRGLNEIFTLLGVDPHPLTAGVERLRTASQREIIENYDELQDVFTNTPWLEYFED